jgi:hypothetical protein
MRNKSTPKINNLSRVDEPLVTEANGSSTFNAGENNIPLHILAKNDTSVLDFFQKKLYTPINLINHSYYV